MVNEIIIFPMDITFATTKLKKQLNEEKEMVRVHGPKRAKILKIVLAQLRAAPNLGIFAPPMSPPYRCHELVGNLKGQLTMDLDHPYRLMFEPNHDSLPQRAEGGLDWKLVTAIEIREIKDTHG
jgi:plasmid maintenance system killer protein